jgi:hypothetical protein
VGHSVCMKRTRLFSREDLASQPERGSERGTYELGADEWGYTRRCWDEGPVPSSWETVLSALVLKAYTEGVG